jgi:hypothetical protein
MHRRLLKTIITISAIHTVEQRKQLTLPAALGFRSSLLLRNRKLPMCGPSSSVAAREALASQSESPSATTELYALPNKAINSNRKAKNSHPWTLFRLGKLRFGFHGIWGILCVAATTASLVSRTATNVWTAVLTNFILGVDARSLTDQAPQSTTIVHNKWVKIVAPHREAFQRTIAVVQHINLRLAEQQLSTSEWALPFPVYAILLGLSWFQFNPVNSDFTNGNTWFFVFPMFLGVSLDCVMQCQGMSNYLTTQYLLAVQLASLFIAFAFTLAFRGMIRIEPIYFGSAAVVGGLFLGVLFYLITARTNSNF